MPGAMTTSLVGGVGLGQLRSDPLELSPRTLDAALPYSTTAAVGHSGLSLLHRLAAIALLVLEDEESAFWCLVAIVETILPAEYYSKTLTASQVSWLHLRVGRYLVTGQGNPPEGFLQASRSWVSSSPTQGPVTPLWLLCGGGGGPVRV